MRCNKIKERLTEYAYGDLSDKAASVVESHITDCASCRQDLQEIKTVLSAALQYEDVDPPEEIHRTLKRQVQAVLQGRWSGLSLLLKPASAYVAVAAIALFAVVSGIGTRIEVERLERMNSLFSDSLRILNAHSAGIPRSLRPAPLDNLGRSWNGPGVQDSAELSDSSDSFLTTPPSESIPGD